MAALGFLFLPFDATVTPPSFKDRRIALVSQPPSNRSPDVITGAAEGGAPTLWPPRGGGGFGDYSVRDLAAKFLVQVDDLAEIERYRTANIELRMAPDGHRRVVMMGDSITDFWPLEDVSPPGVRLINRGISGQNTTMMLMRFQDDVASLEPDAVVILGGSNDLRAYAGDPASLTDSALARISRNIAGMCDMARGRGIEPILATLPPVGGDIAVVARSPRAVLAVNDWIRDFARRRGYLVVDYHAALVGPEGLMPEALSEDGLHPNAHAYARMEPPLLAALARTSASDAQIQTGVVQGLRAMTRDSPDHERSS